MNHDSGNPARRRLISSIVFAAVLIAMAVVFRAPLVAWFTGKSVGEQTGPSVTTTSGPFAISALLDPDPPGTSHQAVVLEIRDSAGKAVDDAIVEVLYDMPAMGAMAEMKGGAKVEHEKEGRYRAEIDLPMAGTWTLKTSIRGTAGSASQNFTFTVGAKGLSLAGAGSGTTASGSSGAQSVKPFEYPEVAFDALRTALDAADRVRAELAKDQIASVTASAGNLAEALRAAGGALGNDRADVRDAVSRAASAAERLASTKSVDEARKAFAELNAELLPAIGADSRLADGWRAFECPMFEHSRWLQHGNTPENPYMGTKMLTCGTATDLQPVASAAASSSAPGEIDHYTCSMHPSVKQQAPGKCPICGMDLVPVTKEQQEQGVVMIDEARRQLIGVRTGQVTEGPMHRSFRAVGQVAYDESKLSDVNMKVQGWITKLYVNQTGQRVAAGQPLFFFYSPELYNAEQDFLLATQGSAPTTGAAGAPNRVELIARAARQRLHLLGLGEAQIDAISKNGAPLESVTITSPASGFVIEKDVVEGASVDPGMRLFRIAALGDVWVEADVYEGDLPHVHVGQTARVTLDYLPGRAYDAKVGYVYPYLDPKARTGRVRVVLANKGLDLRPGMYASVELATDAEPRVQVPASAVVYTGPRRLVFVDLGEGRFRPQEVRVGNEAGGMYEVLEGLRPGDVVATSGIFLIAAEARISTAAKYWDDTGDDRESTPAEPLMPGGSASSSNAAEPMGSSRIRGSMDPAPYAPPSPTSVRAQPAMRPRPPASASAPATAQVFSCPMHPEVRSPAPGKCPKCGMDLERVPSGAPK